MARFSLSRAVLFVIASGLLLSTTNAEPKINYRYLERQHGAQLKSVDYPVRYKFHKETGIAWADSNYVQREAFLTQWHQDLEKQRLQDLKELKDRKKAEQEERKNLINEKKEELKKQKDKLQAEKKTREQERKEKKEFRDTVKKQKEKIKKMRQDQKRKRHNRL